MRRDVRREFSVSPSPVRCDLPPVPLVVEVLPVAGEEAQLTGLRVDGQTLVVLTVDHLPGLGVVPPWPRDLPHLAPGDGHPVSALSLQTPLPIGQLTLIGRNGVKYLVHICAADVN